MVPEEYLLVALKTIMKRALIENLLEELVPFFAYLYNEWITKRKSVLSVWDSEDRTNNVAEAFNAKYQKTMVEVSPNFYQFTGNEHDSLFFEGCFFGF